MTSSAEHSMANIVIKIVDKYLSDIMYMQDLTDKPSFEPLESVLRPLITPQDAK